MNSSRYTSTSQNSFNMSSQRQFPPTKVAPPQQPQPSHGRSSSALSTEPFLKDFTLVAEAAKRAQMAVMMRDFEGIGL
ncbi:hypothetical protein QBC38DRAFT_357565 [Podospora fimiseda]|uniref:Uncharacterized protein n=1 Tax=Podospora fimiseda TaxID=252190 RepID=A0AAN7GZS3_9PEZI|nr:hypothetical protein QBC38DRAFT_357565 [Podospora fimiseda]